MQDSVMQPAVQPFIKLVQSNMALLTQFCMSPDMISQAMSNAQSLLHQGQGSATNVTQSNAFGQLMQGMLRNYTEFMAEFGQSAMAMLTQAQTATMQSASEAAESVADSEPRSRRTR